MVELKKKKRPRRNLKNDQSFSCEKKRHSSSRLRARPSTSSRYKSRQSPGSKKKNLNTSTQSIHQPSDFTLKDPPKLMYQNRVTGKTLKALKALSLKQQRAIIAELTSVQNSKSVCCFFHLFFKFFSAFAYLFLSMVISSTLTNFLLVLGCVVLDFWITKNVTGRRLVGMRWWSAGELGFETDFENSANNWRFESFSINLNYNPFDVNVFWVGNLFMAVFWLLMAFGKILSFNLLWGLLTMIAAGLACTNFYAYILCYKYQRQQMASSDLLTTLL